MEFMAGPHGWTQLGTGWYRHGKDPNFLVNVRAFDPTKINGKGTHVSEMDAHERSQDGYVVIWSNPSSVRIIAKYETKTEALDSLPDILKRLDSEGIESFDNLAEELGVRGVDIAKD